MPPASPSLSLWHGQLLHFLSLSGLLIVAWYAWLRLGEPNPIAFWVALSIPIAHQVFVWLSWRIELRYSLISGTIGFKAYLIIFFVLFVSRFVSLFILAWLDRHSLSLNPGFQAVAISICLFLGIYAMYSVFKYFGMARAAGADHFDSDYRSMPLIKDGMFRYSSNSMYVFAFLLFWAIAIGFNSASALIVAAFSHLYIWIHFICTEKPDMEYIYGKVSSRTHN